MVKIFVHYKNDIERYCAANGLSSKKVFGSARSYNDKSVILQYVDHEKGKLGLLDETPADVTLAIFLEEGQLRFEQTEHTRKYLSVSKESTPVTMPEAAVA